MYGYSSTRPFAVISDIHGNAPALEAVLADIDERNIETVINLGDTFYGPLDPSGTEQLIRGRQFISVLGNQDRVLVEPCLDYYSNATFRYTMGHLSQWALDWLAGQKGDQWLWDNEILCCHGAPGNDCAYLAEDISDGHPELRSCREITTAMGGHRPSLVLCGHSHIPREIRCGELTVVNPGSVGLPAYNDDDPPHTMSTGTPHARYAVVTPRPDRWMVTPVDVEYDWQAAASLALANDRPDWSEWLRTGKAP